MKADNTYTAHVGGMFYQFDLSKFAPCLNLSRKDDREEAERYALLVAQAHRTVELVYGSHIPAGSWDKRFFEKVFFEPDLPNAHGQYHWSWWRRNYYILLSLRSFRNRWQRRNGQVQCMCTMVHEFLHHPVLGVHIELRYLEEAVVEYLARRACHTTEGSYNKLLEVLEVLIQSLNHGEDTLLNFAFKEDGLVQQINQRFHVRFMPTDLDELAQLFEFLPTNVPDEIRQSDYFKGSLHSRESLFDKARRHEVAQVIEGLLAYVQAYDELGDDRRCNDAVYVAQSFIRRLVYRADWLGTVVIPRSPHLPAPPPAGASPSPKAPSKGAKRSVAEHMILAIARVIWLIGAIGYWIGENVGWPLIKLGGRTSLALFKYWWKLKLWPRLISGAVMGIALLLIAYFAVGWLLIYPGISSLPVPNRYPPAAAGRFAMSQAELELRKELYIKHVGQYTLLHHRDKPAEGARRMSQYWTMLQRVGRDRGVDPYTLRAIAYQESYFDASAYNADSGAAGMFQVLRSTAVLEGLVVGSRDFRLIFKNGDDFRFDPERSAYTTGELYRQAFEYWREPHISVWEHHAGRANLQTVFSDLLDETHPEWRKSGKSVSRSLRDFGLGYWDILLRIDPVHTPKTWASVHQLVDSSLRYPMRVEAARRLLALHDTAPAEFFAKAQFYSDITRTYRFEKPTEIPAKWWTWYTPDQLTTKDCDAMKQLLDSGEWVPIPDKPAQYGYRLDGMGWVRPDLLNSSEKNHNDSHRSRHRAARQETIGMLLYIAKLYAQMFIEEQGRYQSFTVTSLGRSRWFQDRLIEMGMPATDQLPVHVGGWAVDITRNGMSPQQQVFMAFVLDDLESMGLLSWSPERAAFHVVPSPDPEVTAFYREIYQNRDKQKLFEFGRSN